METGTRDEANGTAYVIKGAVKETVGRLTNDADLEADGRGEKIVGKLQKKIGQLKKVLK